MPVRVVPAHGVGGGMERVTWTLAAGLARRGHDVTVATTAHPAGLVADQSEGVRVLYVGDATWRRYRRGWWDTSYERLREDHDAAPYDVILSQSAGGLGYLERARRDLAVPSVVLLHGSARGELRTTWRGARDPRGLYRLARLGWRLPRQVARWRAAAPGVARWLAVSDEVAEDNRRELGLPAPAVTVVPVGVDTDRFRPDPADGASVRAELGIPPAAPVVVLATRLEREKGVEIALAAARSVRAGRPDLHLVIAGRGHDDRRLRRLAADLGLAGACRFLGLVDHDRLPSVLAAGDVFVHPSLCAEGRPVSLSEASAAGLPVVASDSAGTRQIVVDGVTGRVTRRGDARSLTTALEELLDDEPLRAAMGRAGRQAAESRWSTGSMLDAVEGVLGDTVGQPPAREPWGRRR